jgi:hypothetical protein
MGHASATAALVTSSRLTLRGIARQARTAWCAVALTSIAVAAKPDLGRAPCAQEQAGGTVHTPPRAPSPRCWTDASQRATLWWHRLHRHGVGCGAGLRAAKRWTAAVPDLLRHRRALYNARLGIRHRPGKQQPAPNGCRRPLCTPSIATHNPRQPARQGRSLRLYGRPPGVHTGEELIDAAAPSRNHRLKHRSMQNRILTAE